MQSILNRRVGLLVSMCLVVALLGLAACGSPQAQTQAKDPVRVGTMPTEDILPLWAAEADGYFEQQDMDVEVVVFDSAQSLSAAITAGEVDLAMTDIMRAAKLVESGCDLTIEWITLGSTPAQGRFGILAAPDSGMRALDDLSSGTKGVGLADNTVPEYVFDMLCAQAGVDPESIVVSEVASLPDRYALVASGQLDAAALPGSLLALGEASGMIVIADDTQGDNVSQSIMVARTAFAQEGGSQAIEAIAGAWDWGAEAINANPEGYRELLIERANLNDVVAESYPISEYPLALTPDGAIAHPAANLVDSVLAWMKSKSYLNAEMLYDPATGVLSIG